MRRMSVSEFRERVRREIRGICEENGWNPNSPQKRGTSFEIWCAQNIADNDERFDTDAHDAIVGGSGDLGADLVFRNDSTNETLICQCKYSGGSGVLPDDVVDSFTNLHQRLSSRDYIAEHSGTGIVEALPPQNVFRSAPDKFTYRLITNGRISKRAKDRYSTSDRGGDLPKIELWDRDDLIDFYLEVESPEELIPKKVVIDLDAQQHIDLEVPYAGVVTVLTTNSLRRLWDEFGRRIISQNIRGPLNTTLNADMKATLQQRPKEFLYFNNGVSAICTDFEIRGGQLHAESLQIINGAQTLRAIGDNDLLPGRVLFRLTKTKDVSTDSGFASEIIRYNNRQNVVRDSDFRSNDRIQEWLQREFDRSPWRWPALERRYYVRKREYGARRGIGKALKLEEFAKIRYAWLFEPVVVNDAGRSLFQDNELSGRYTQTFGIDGEMMDSWPLKDLEEAVLAVWFYFQIVSLLQGTRNDNPEQYGWLPRHRWHFLSLAGIYARQRGLVAADLLGDRSRCVEVFKDYFPKAWEVIMRAEDRRKNDDRGGQGIMSLRNWRRSHAVWSSLLGQFNEDVKADEALAVMLDRLP